MNIQQIFALATMVFFYASYYTKMLFQRRKGITTNQIGKGQKPPATLRVEGLLKVATAAIIPIEIVSILANWRLWSGLIGWIGLVIAATGVAVFVIAMTAMRDSWRAGIPDSDKTALVTSGIYRISRNPAFFGFDLMYGGLMLAFANPVHILFGLFAIVMLHLQILQEEKYLTQEFGESYRRYRHRTARYFGWRVTDFKAS